MTSSNEIKTAPPSPEMKSCLRPWRTKQASLVYSQTVCKNSKQGRAEDVVFVHAPWSRVCQQAFSTLPEDETHSLFNGTKSRNRIFHRRANDQNAFVSNLVILHTQRHWKIRRRASTLFTILQCNISSQHKTKQSWLSSKSVISQQRRRAAHGS